MTRLEVRKLEGSETAIRWNSVEHVALASADVGSHSSQCTALVVVPSQPEHQSGTLDTSGLGLVDITLPDLIRFASFFAVESGKPEEDKEERNGYRWHQTPTTAGCVCTTTEGGQKDECIVIWYANMIWRCRSPSPVKQSAINHAATPCSTRPLSATASTTVSAPSVAACPACSPSALCLSAACTRLLLCSI